MPITSNPLATGLMVIGKLKDEVAAIQDAIRLKIARAIELVAAFPTITEDDVMINFEVPKHLGIGVARGSATPANQQKRTVLDYSGRCLNLAARLMDLARPAGRRPHDQHAGALLGPEIIAKLHAEDVYVKGIAEEFH
jgi:class 3 adenylate cyclase